MSQVCRSQMSAVAATIQSGVGCGLLAGGSRDDHCLHPLALFLDIAFSAF